MVTLHINDCAAVVLHVGGGSIFGGVDVEADILCMMHTKSLDVLN